MLGDLYRFPEIFPKEKKSQGQMCMVFYTTLWYYHRMPPTYPLTQLQRPPTIMENELLFKHEHSKTLDFHVFTLNISLCLLEKTVMDKATHVLIDVFFVSLRFAKFLLNTRRILEAVKLCKECLILLSNKTLEKELEFVNLSYIAVYCTMLKGYRLNNDHASGIECCRNLLEVVRRSGEKDKEGRMIYELATLHQRQCNYKEARDLYKKALCITIETGELRGEGMCYGNLGTLSQCLCEYGKAEEYLQKALAICKELGDRMGEASCYGNLGTCFQFLSDYSKAEEYLMQALAIRKEIGDK